MEPGVDLNSAVNQWIDDQSAVQVTLGRGQQAHPPLAVLQQVAFPGHDVDLSHLLSSVSRGKTGVLGTSGISATPEG